MFELFLLFLHTQTLNTELSYKIASVIPNNPFLINEDTGVLEVTGNIDRESVPFYNV